MKHSWMRCRTGKRRLNAVQPDMVGEALLLRIWPGDQGMAPVLRAAAVQTRRVAQTVIRACQDFAIHGHVEPLAWLDGLGAEAARDLQALLALLDDLRKTRWSCASALPS
jgi:hypothetical protein